MLELEEERADGLPSMLGGQHGGRCPLIKGHRGAPEPGVGRLARSEDLDSLSKDFLPRGNGHRLCLHRSRIIAKRPRIKSIETDALEVLAPVQFQLTLRRPRR